jgi:hypothetical protein
VVHLLTYELVGVRMPDEVTRIEEAIKAMGECFAFHKAAWFIDTELSNKEVCAKIVALLKSRDRIVVTRIHRDWVAANLPQAETDWLSSRNFHSASDPSAVPTLPPRRM